MDVAEKAPIVVGVDGSESATGALRYAARLAERLGNPIRVVSTWDLPALVDYREGHGWDMESIAGEILESSLDAVFGDQRPPGLTSSVRPGPPAAALIDESRGAELLVLGSRGRGGFVGLLLGSVSATCAAHAHCPVLIARDSADQ
ncbi:MAG: universal stress protein [Microbacterium sp.]